MRKVLLLLCLMIGMVVNAQNNTKVGNVELGTDYATALEQIKAEYGEPVSVTENMVTYKNKRHEGMNFDEVVFKFRNGKFNEARFYQKAGSRAASQKQLEVVAKEMGKNHNMTKDFEDGRIWFYKGGKAPVGLGHFMTISSTPRQGTYYTELRYGPFSF